MGTDRPAHLEIAAFQRELAAFDPGAEPVRPQ